MTQTAANTSFMGRMRAKFARDRAALAEFRDKIADAAAAVVTMNTNAALYATGENRAEHACGFDSKPWSQHSSQQYDG
jgi:hypothetical protein